jgi:hypothetical protein
MPPMHGMPVLPDGVYPVDYDDLCNLSGMLSLLQVLLKSFYNTASKTLVLTSSSTPSTSIAQTTVGTRN